MFQQKIFCILLESDEIKKTIGIADVGCVNEISKS